MKIIATLIAMLAISSAHAELYKCKVKGRTTYQEKPCQGAGSEFKLRKDISVEQQQTAQAKLQAELAERAEKQRQLEALKQQRQRQTEQLLAPPDPTTRPQRPVRPQMPGNRAVPMPSPRRY